MPWRSKRIDTVWAGIPYSQTPLTKGKSSFLAMGEKDRKGGKRNLNLDSEGKKMF